MTDVEIYQPSPAAVAVADGHDTDSWITVCSDVIKLANVVHDTEFVPEGLRGSAPAVAAAILAGREMGLGPMTALQHIHIIKGKPAQSALLMRALIQAAGHKWEDGDVTDTRAVVRGCRRGESRWLEVTFTADQAKKAGIDLGKYPADKLYARATSRLARRKFADVIAGMPYSAEELEDGDEAPAEHAPAVAAAGNGDKPAQRTAQRRQRPAEPQPDPAPAAAATPVAAAPADQPPLPGEDEAPAPNQRKIIGVIHQHFKRLGFDTDERDQRLTATAAIAGLDDLDTSSNLTEQQAKTVADTLSRCKDRDALIALLAAGDAPDA